MTTPGLNLRPPAGTLARGELAGHHPAWARGEHLHLQPRAQAARLPRFPWPDLARETPDRAIAIAKRAGLPLKIAAKVDAVDTAYFHEVVEPLLDHPLIEFVGEIGDSEKSAFLGNAQALLFPIDWPEPFGLVMIEAMACGTPVIAWHCGSVPEIVDHGETGFIVATEDEAVAALARLQLIDRRRVRDVFEERFTATVMARNYLRLYWRLYAGIKHAVSIEGIGKGVHGLDGLPGLLVQPVDHDHAGHLESSAAAIPQNGTGTCAS